MNQQGLVESRLAGPWLKLAVKTVLVELLWEKNTVPTKKTSRIWGKPNGAKIPDKSASYVPIWETFPCFFGAYTDNYFVCSGEQWVRWGNAKRGARLSGANWTEWWPCSISARVHGKQGAYWTYQMAEKRWVPYQKMNIRWANRLSYNTCGL